MAARIYSIAPKLMWIGLAGMFLNILSGILSPDYFKAEWIPQVIFLASFLLILTGLLIRHFALAVGFSKFTLGQFMGMVIAVGLCVSLILTADEDLKWLPTLALIFLLLLIYAYITAQDPTGFRFIPPYVRDKLRADRALAREEKKRREIERGEVTGESKSSDSQ